MKTVLVTFIRENEVQRVWEVTVIYSDGTSYGHTEYTGRDYSESDVRSLFE